MKVHELEIKTNTILLNIERDSFVDTYQLKKEEVYELYSDYCVVCYSIKDKYTSLTIKED